MYTRCPKCSTCFRVTDRHLAIAKGKVRCGQCQLVFNATENAIDDLPATTASSTPAQTINKPSPATTSQVKVKKPVEPVTAKKTKESIVPPPKVAPPLFKADATMVEDLKINKDEVKKVNLDIPSPPHDAFHEDDDSFDENFDFDAAIDELTHAADKITYDFDSSAKIEEPSSPKEDKKEKRNEDVFTTDAYDATNATSVADILTEMEGQLSLNITEPSHEIKGDYDTNDEFEFIALDNEPGTEAKTENDHAKQEHEETNDEFIKNNFDIEEFGINDEDLFENDKPEKEKNQESNVDKDELLDEIDLNGFQESELTNNIILDESHEENIGKHSDGYEVPLRLRDDIESLHAPSARQLHPVIKLSFIVILLVLSFSQVAYFRAFELVNIIPETRPLLEKFCENIGCQYSGPHDSKQIELMSRDVRLHPKEKKALLISAAMINNANFAQPYPDIHIRLSDISGNIVAERTFNPKIYMGKLSNPFLLMRSKTPVHINFEVVDPGKDAVNFEFTFL